METLILLFILLGSLVYVASPYLRKGVRSGGSVSWRQARLRHLYSRRDIVLTSIKDLEFDREMGKISNADFPDIDTRYRHDAIRLLKEIDLLESGDGSENSRLAESSKKDLRKSPRSTDPCPACSTLTYVGDRFCRQCGGQLPSQER